MRVLDSRRLRGRSLGAEGPAAVAEVWLAGLDPAAFEAAWRQQLARALDAVGLGPLAAGARVRPFAGGLSVLLPGPLDLLLALVDVNEWALDAARRALAGRSTDLSSRQVREWTKQLRQDARPRLGALLSAAAERGVPVLSDDDALTLGLGATAKSWPMDALPAPGEVPWDALGRIPVALITGTNGKTTTTRLVARMAKHAGLVPGNSSTDGVTIDERIEEGGDWTGAEAARKVLRDPRVQIALLETARGGILRRGLAIEGVDAALVTNVAADHLGEYGVLTVDDMTRTKFVVAEAVRPGGWIVLAEELLPALPRPREEVMLFSASPGPGMAAHLATGRHAFVIEDGRIVHRHGPRAEPLVPLSEVPLTFGGRAPHNVKNALAASALAFALGLPREAIAAGLRSFGAAPGDNPGRGELVERAGVRLLADFGHNAAGMVDLLALARALAPSPAEVVLVTTLAGDRTDEAYEEYAAAIARGGVDRVVVWEQESLLRGRRPGEPTGLLLRALARQGARAEAADDQRAAMRAAVQGASAGDLVVVAPDLLRLPRAELGSL